MLKDKARQAIKKQQLLQPGDRIVVGVSGGADSMALLHFLWQEGKKEHYHLIAAHINHLLRGAEADRDEDFVRQFCLERNIRYCSQRVDVKKLAQQQKRSFEECGRLVRYKYFRTLCENDGKIATAHTLSDRIETMLFNMARGTSLNGLVSIPYKRENIVRPLLDCLREEVEAYCRENAISYMTDSTNADLQYARNYIRITIVPALQKINASFLHNAQDLFANLEDDAHLLNAMAEDKQKQYIRDKQLSIQAYYDLEKPVWRRILMAFLKQNAIEISNKRIRLIEKLIQEENGKLTVGKGHYISITKENLHVFNEKREMKAPYFEKNVQMGKNVFLGNIWSLKILSKLDYKNTQKIYKNLSFCILDYDRIIGNLKVRTRLPHDKIKLPNRPTKFIKKLFNENKIDVYDRSRLLIFADDMGIVYIEGIGIDQRVAITDATQTYGIILKGE